MNIMWLYIGLWLFGVGLVSFISRWKHILCVLLSLEMMTLGIYVLFVCGVYVWGGGWVGLIFLGMAVCEGAFGLGLVVSLVRSYGSDCLFGFIGDVGYYV